ncbi:MAG: hypothetical protein A3J46_04165 [Candidatus Yanofskybacteria bacterium RIFCSPHIGHO2_02_FULL_41_11]|uniref:Uncharacterized protein n=1 Tax=Candidatus Yanofskybacteria bacterium RIFCSPHIGHO2_02_FULL_41_11 TaxID=1802675 RepID=A0A1F8FCN3_9BACT|nr:MAG: hypothetical protein A3J46_04165 [Candidatus Yanofskybacteria bacterium RIFCSPHIGHO2_02_FULL_41_11]
MNINNKNVAYIVLTGVVAITLIWLSRNDENQKPKFESLFEEGVLDNTVNEGSLNTLEGTLWSSDDEAKGNLMLAVNNGATIYIRTSRNFSDLIGKYVLVSIDGTLENFTLVNIEENLTKGGFIQAN